MRQGYPQEPPWTDQHLLQTLGPLLLFPSGRDWGWVSSFSSGEEDTPEECHRDALPDLICARQRSPGVEASEHSHHLPNTLPLTVAFLPPFIPLREPVGSPGAPERQREADPGPPYIPPPGFFCTPAPAALHPFSSLRQRWKERRSRALGWDQTGLCPLG